MNTIITDIYTLLSTAADFADDTGTHTKVEIFRDYDEKLIEIFPVIFMRRESVQMRIKSMPSKYECTYGVQIFVAVDNFVDRSEMEKSLDEIVTNVVKVRHRIQHTTAGYRVQHNGLIQMWSGSVTARSIYLGTGSKVP